MSPFHIVTNVAKVIVKVITLGYKSYTVVTTKGDEHLINKQDAKERLEKNKEDETIEVKSTAVKASFLNRLKYKIQPITRLLVDFITSSSVGRLIILSSAVLMFFSPISPWLALAACVITIVGVVAGITYDTYKSYKLGRLQKESKLLEKLSNLVNEKNLKLQELEKSIQKVIEPGLKLRYEIVCAQLLQQVDKELYKFPGYSKKEYQASWSKAFAKSMLTNTPESLASLVMSIFTLNPIAYSLAAASSILTYSQEVKKAKAYDNHKAMLLNQSEKVKEELGISYSPGQGVKLLKDIINVRYAEKAALEKLIDKVNIAISKNEEIDSVDKLMLEFQKERTGELKKHNIEPPDTIQEVISDFFTRMGKVIIYGFSARKTKELFSPLVDGVPDSSSNMIYVSTSESSKNDPMTPHKSKTQKIIEERASSRVLIEEFISKGAKQPEINVSKTKSIQAIRAEEAQKLVVRQVASKEQKDSWKQLAEEQERKSGKSGSGPAPVA